MVRDPARIVDLRSIVEGEFHENEIRKDFTASERVAIGETIERELGNRQGERTDLTSAQTSGSETRELSIG